MTKIHLILFFGLVSAAGQASDEHLWKLKDDRGVISRAVQGTAAADLIDDQAKVVITGDAARQLLLFAPQTAQKDPKAGMKCVWGEYQGKKTVGCTLQFDSNGKPSNSSEGFGKWGSAKASGPIICKDGQMFGVEVGEEGAKVLYATMAGFTPLELDIKDENNDPSLRAYISKGKLICNRHGSDGHYDYLCTFGMTNAAAIVNVSDWFLRKECR